MSNAVVTTQPGAVDAPRALGYEDAKKATQIGRAFAPTNHGKKSTGDKKRPGRAGKPKELPSQRRGDRLMEILPTKTFKDFTEEEAAKKAEDNSIFNFSDDSSSDEDEGAEARSKKGEPEEQLEEEAEKKPVTPRVVVVRNQYGKTRPLNAHGRFTDRRPPPGPPPPSATRAAQEQQQQPQGPPKGMPYMYASASGGVVLTRGQYLDLASAQKKKAERDAARAAAEAEALEMEQRWACDPRMLPGWTAHYSKKHRKCYFVHGETQETLWKPPGKWPERPVTPPPPPTPVRVEPKWVRGCKACGAGCGGCVDTVCGRPRWFKSLKRSVGLGLAPLVDPCLAAGGCCGEGASLRPPPVPFGNDGGGGGPGGGGGGGAGACEAEEICEALGLTEADKQALFEAFCDADLDGGGEVSEAELFDWFGEPATAFSKSVFKLADMDDSGLIDFPEFVKVVCVYAAFNQDDVFKWGFDLFDTDGSGYIDEYELATLVEQINGDGDDDGGGGSGGKNGNLQEALKVIDNGDGVLDFMEFCALCKRLPLVIYPALRLQKTMMRKTLGEERWGFVLWNLAREKRVQEYMRTHHGRRPAGDFKAPTRVLLEKLPCCFACVPPLPKTYPDYVDGLRPAASTRPDGTFGEGHEREPDFDLSGLVPPSFT